MKKIVKSSSVSDPEFIYGTRVLFNGEDISHRCHAAEIYDDGTGAAFCYKQRTEANDKMTPYIDPETGDIARETFEGNVEIIFP